MSAIFYLTKLFIRLLSGESNELPPMQENRNGCCAVISRFRAQSIVVFGGFGSRTVETFNPILNAWQSKPPMIEARQFGAAATL